MTIYVTIKGYITKMCKELLYKKERANIYIAKLKSRYFTKKVYKHHIDIGTDAGSYTH